MGFKLRSGNGPLQFKQMGATPVKGLGELFAKGLSGGKEGGLVSEERRINPKKDAKDLGATEAGEKIKRGDYEVPQKPKGPSTRAEIDAAKKVNTLREDALNTPGTREAIASIGTTKGQKKKQGRLDKINKRQYKQYQNDAYENRGFKDSLKGRKKWLAEQEASGNLKNQEDWAASDLNKETNREARLKKEVGMTAKEYEANQAKKAQTWQDDFMRASLTIPKGSDPADVIAFDESVRTRDARDETTKVDNAYKKLLTKTGAEAYEAKQKELSQTENFAGNEEETNMDNTEKKNKYNISGGQHETDIDYK